MTVTDATPEGFQRAQLAIEDGQVIECLFNPTEYTITKTNTWNYKPVVGASLPTGAFGGGNARELSVSLLLDASLLKPKQTVRSVTDALFKMMDVKAGKKPGPTAAPPTLEFRWGAVETFKAVCASLTVAYQLFEPNGEPIRADVKLSLKQAETASTRSSNGTNQGTNPTTRAKAGFGVHTVRDGDSLPSIAYQTYGDATLWRVIAEANDIANPMHLRRGTPLSLPRLES